MITTVEHLARRVGADARTLRRASDQGAVRCTRLSPRRIEVAADEERYLREHWPLLARLRALLRTEPNVRFAALFGSAARGDARGAPIRRSSSQRSTRAGCSSTAIALGRPSSAVDRCCGAPGPHLGISDRVPRPVIELERRHIRGRLRRIAVAKALNAWFTRYGAGV